MRKVRERGTRGRYRIANSSTCCRRFLLLLCLFDSHFDVRYFFSFVANSCVQSAVFVPRCCVYIASNGTSDSLFFSERCA